MKKLLSMLLVLSIFQVQSWARVPLPKFHLTRYYGVFAKASKYRDKLPDWPPPKPDDPNASSTSCNAASANHA